MRDNGFIKLHRKMLSWEWYTDQNTFKVFIHCLLKANYTDKKWQGNDVSRGSFISSPKNIGIEIGLGRQQVRTALEKLESTDDLTIKPTNRFSLITILNYDKYQGEVTSKLTINQPASQPTDNHQVTTTKKEKKEKNNKNINNKNKKINKIINNSTYSEIIEYLNNKTQKSFKAQNTKTLYQILIDNGYTHDDFYTVIDNMVASWQGTEYSNGLCPGTLFKNPSQFEKWLNWGPDTNNPNNGDVFEDDDQYL